jgi:uncharacterized membrane protein
MSLRARIAVYGFTALLIIAGAVCAAALDAGTGQFVGFLLIGAGLIIATGLVFLEVGLSEDRERARERDAVLGGRPPMSRRLKFQRVERSRGHRRRLR